MPKGKGKMTKIKSKVVSKKAGTMPMKGKMSRSSMKSSMRKMYA